MNNDEIKISDEVLKNISVEELVDLKIEIDDIIAKFNNIEEMCDETINSQGRKIMDLKTINQEYLNLKEQIKNKL